MLLKDKKTKRQANNQTNATENMASMEAKMKYSTRAALHDLLKSANLEL